MPRSQNLYLAILVFCLTTACQTPSIKLTSPQLTWTFYPSEELTGNRTHSFCEVHQGDLLVFGGIVEGIDSQLNSDLYRFHQKDQTWHKLSNHQGPTPLNQASLARYESKILLFGGQSQTASATNKAFVLDLTTDQWVETAQPIALTPRKQATVTRVGEQLVVFGGQADRPIENWGVYDIHRNQWTIHASPPLARTSHITVALDDTRMMVWGGFEGKVRKADGFILNIKTQEVTELPPIPWMPPTANARAIALDKHIYIWGGVAADGTSNRGAIFNKATLSWEPMPSIPDSRFSILRGAELVQWDTQHLLLIGGRFGTAAFNQEVWQYSVPQRTWTSLRTQPSIPGRIAHCAIKLNPLRLAVFGGLGYADNTQTLQAWSGVWILDASPAPP